jgi:uncharacterized protein YnzC (UPF0291/DUF896 family)
MKKETAVDYFSRQLKYLDFEFGMNFISRVEFQKKRKEIFIKAKEIENTEKLKHQLFIGKVVDEIGMDNTFELLKEVKQTFE